VQFAAKQIRSNPPRRSPKGEEKKKNFEKIESDRINIKVLFVPPTNLPAPLSPQMHDIYLGFTPTSYYDSLSE